MANIKQHAEDFIVKENLPFQPCGQGEHAFLCIEKKGENTEFVARQLAKLATVKQRDVGFAGLKDRHALTTQWFSVWLPGKRDPDWHFLESDQIKLLAVTRHDRKLRRGAIASNSFTIRLTDWNGDQSALEQRLHMIKEQGVPNYYGQQRFGRRGDNVNQALTLHKQGKLHPHRSALYISAVRAFLFNTQLAQRVQAGSWNALLAGDICNLNHSKSVFIAEKIDETLWKRLRCGDIHPAGMMWGSRDIAELEINLEERLQPLATLISAFKLERAYRAFRVIPEDLTWQFSTQHDLSLSFDLPSGSYATALIREIIREPSGLSWQHSASPRAD